MENKAQPTSIRLTLTSDRDVREWAAEKGVSLSDMIEMLVRAEKKRRNRQKK